MYHRMNAALGVGTLAEPGDVARFEQERWEKEGWEVSRDKHVGRLKGQHAQMTKRRIANFEYAKLVLPHIQAIYNELDYYEAGEAIGGKRLAEALAARGVKTQKGQTPTILSDSGKAWANALVQETDASLIADAVLECRTRMTALCLSANFESQTVDTLEAEYVEIIADMLALGRALRNQPVWPRTQLIEQAWGDAKEQARQQRQEKPPVTMAQRERFWRDRPPPVRKIFG